MGSALIEALVFGCNMDWDLAWGLVPEEDYQWDVIDNYDLNTHLVVPGGFYESRRIAGALFFVRLHKDVQEVTSEGVMFPAYSCTPQRQPDPHPYSHYGAETLEAMAYADAEAAALLGRRLIGADTPRAFDLLIRAAALDGGNVRHIAWLSDQAFGTLEINGRPQVINIERQYELAALAARLGDPAQDPAFFRKQLVDIGVDADRLKSLDAEVEALLQSMRDIQRTVLGEVTIGGHSDA